jgi:chromosome segregation ATPase
MSENLWGIIISSLPGALIALGALLLSYLRHPKELNKTTSETAKLDQEAQKISGADTVETYAKAAEIIGKINITLTDRIDQLDNKVADLIKALEERERIIEELEVRLKERDELIVNFKNEIMVRDARIRELENVSVKNEKRIHDLELEVQSLRKSQDEDNLNR